MTTDRDEPDWRFLCNEGIAFLHTAKAAGLSPASTVWVCLTLAGVCGAEHSQPGDDNRTVEAAAKIVADAIALARAMPGGQMETVQ